MSMWKSQSIALLLTIAYICCCSGVTVRADDSEESKSSEQFVYNWRPWHPCTSNGDCGLNEICVKGSDFLGYPAQAYCECLPKYFWNLDTLECNKRITIHSLCDDNNDCADDQLCYNYKYNQQSSCICPNYQSYDYAKQRCIATECKSSDECSLNEICQKSFIWTNGTLEESELGACECISSNIWDYFAEICRQTSCLDYCDFSSGYQCVNDECRWFSPPQTNDEPNTIPLFLIVTLFGFSAIVAAVIWRCAINRRIRQMHEQRQRQHADAQQPQQFSRQNTAQQSQSDEPPKYSQLEGSWMYPETTRENSAEQRPISQAAQPTAPVIFTISDANYAPWTPTATASQTPTTVTTHPNAGESTTVVIDSPPPYSEIAPSTNRSQQQQF